MARFTNVTIIINIIMTEPGANYGIQTEWQRWVRELDCHPQNQREKLGFTQAMQLNTGEIHHS